MIMLKILLYPLHLFVEAWGHLVNDGTWWLRPYERRLIDACAAELSPENRAVLKKQLASMFYVQRLHQDRLASIHFHWRESVEKMSLPKDYRLAKAKLTYGRRSVTVSVEAFDGIIYALKYYKPPRPIIRENFDIAKIEYGGKGDESITRSIDCEEHGVEFE